MSYILYNKELAQAYNGLAHWRRYIYDTLRQVLFKFQVSSDFESHVLELCNNITKSLEIQSVPTDPLTLGTCESFFCVRIESRIESAVYTTQAVTPSDELQGAPCRRTV